MSAIALDTDGCETASRSAALPMLPSSATVNRTCRSCSLSRRPIRSFHFIARLRQGARALIDIRLCCDQKKELFLYPHSWVAFSDRLMHWLCSWESAMTAHGQWLRTGLLCLVAASMPVGSPAWAQSYPAGPVRFITSIAAGSGTDSAMRIVVEQLGRMWGQQTTLVNQPGAGGALATRAAYTAAPDGHMLFMADCVDVCGASAAATQPFRQKFQDFSLSTRTMSPLQLADFISGERALWKPVVTQMGLATQ